MNTRERFIRTLTGKETDRVPFMKIFGGANTVNPEWENEYPGISDCLDELIGFEGKHRGWQRTRVNMELCGTGKDEMMEDTDTRKVIRKGDGRLVVTLKKGKQNLTYTKEWPVDNANDWVRIKDAYLDANDPLRFPADWDVCIAEYRQRDYPLQLSHGGVYGFARKMMGDERLAYAFYDDPSYVHDIMDTYTDMCIKIWDRMVRDAEFDLIECWEDMAFNSGPLISPELFNEFMKPNYLKIKSFADDNRIPIILVDSDGRIDKLVPLMLAVGINCMYPFEVQAGCDVRKILDIYRGLGACGGLDKNVMDKGKDAIDREMERARRMIQKGRLIPGPDHFPINAGFENYRYFMQRLKEVIFSTPVDGC